MISVGWVCELKVGVEIFNKIWFEFCSLLLQGKTSCVRRFRWLSPGTSSNSLSSTKIPVQNLKILVQNSKVACLKPGSRWIRAAMGRMSDRPLNYDFDFRWTQSVRRLALFSAARRVFFSRIRFCFEQTKAADVFFSWVMSLEHKDFCACNCRQSLQWMNEETVSYSGIRRDEWQIGPSACSPEAFVPATQFRLR